MKNKDTKNGYVQTDKPDYSTTVMYEVVSEESEESGEKAQVVQQEFVKEPDENELKAFEQRAYGQKNVKKKKHTGIIVFLGLAVVFAALIALPIIGYLTFFHIVPFSRYKYAGYQVENEQFDVAYDTYVALGEYKDSSSKAIETIYAKAEYLEEQKYYSDAANEYERIPDYLDSTEKAIKCRNENEYLAAIDKFNASQFEAASEIFGSLGDYSDSVQWLNKSQYALAGECYDRGEYDKAYTLFEALGDYSDADSRATESKYMTAESALENKQYQEAGDLFAELRLKKYKDSEAKYYEASYLYGKECLDAEEYDTAVTYLTRANGYSDAGELLKSAKYEQALNLLKNSKYKDAVDAFKAMNGFKDSKSKMLEAMYGYVKKNKNNWDTTTYNYLTELKKAGYSDSASIYSTLYAWKLDYYFNTSQSGTTSSQLSKYGSVYCHFTLSGGPPNGEIALAYVVTFPNGQRSSKAWFTNKFMTGESGWVGWADGIYTNPAYGATGNLTITFYDDNGNVVGSCSGYVYN